MGAKVMEKIRYGVIGIKGVGQVHIRAAKANPHVELVALVDTDEAAVSGAAMTHGVRAFTNYVDLLDADLVDAVSIAVPHSLHYPIGMDCLRAGLHVYMEKPFVTRISEADGMLALAKKKQLHIAVGHQYRTQRSAQRVKQLLDSGMIGRPLRVLWTWGEFRPESYYRRDVWRNTFQDAGGGILMNQTSHDLDLLCWMMGKPKQVSAMLGNQLHQTEIEDIACANVLFENGAMASYQCTVNHPKSYSVRQIEGEQGIIVMPDVQSLTYDQDEEILVGTYQAPLFQMAADLPGKDDQPTIAWSSCGFKQPPPVKDNPGILTRGLRRLGVLRRPNQPPAIQKPVSGFQELMDGFVDAICHGGEPLVSGNSARTTIELINAMYLSALRKKTVELPLDPHEYDEVLDDLVKGKLAIPRLRTQLSS